MADGWDEYRRAVLDRLEQLAAEGRERKAETSAELGRVELRLASALEAAEERLERMIREGLELFRSMVDRAGEEIEGTRDGHDRRLVELERRVAANESRIAALRARAALIGAAIGSVLGAVAGAVSSHLFRSDK